jgi:arginine N-succinyltransferase
MFVLRDASLADLDDVEAVARHLDSVNLPDDRQRLHALIEISQRSFAGQIDVADRRFLFVLVDEGVGRVVGVSMIFAQHGSRRSPHVFFDVIEEQRYSETLDTHFTHRLLRIGYNYKGLTEIGGLVLLPAYRRHPDQLGKLLSYVRFLYMGLHRRIFCDEVVSELMPPLEPDGTSLLWESLGRKFTGLSYQEADQLSHQNKEFIRTLFPQDPLYATLLPPHVQQLIGEVGPETKGVEKMLREIGFEYAHRIDPFDGGPHFHAATDQITLVRQVRPARLTSSASSAGPTSRPPPRPYLVASEHRQAPFVTVTRVVAGPVEGDTLSLASADALDVCRLLRISPGDMVTALPLLPA